MHAFRTMTLLVFLTLLDIAVRLTPHTPNCTPIAATALFAVALLDNWWLAGLVPIIAMGVTDFFIGVYDWRVMLTVYAALVFPVILGPYVRGNRSPIRVLPCALVSSVFFFIATNFGVWCFTSLYAPDLGGLLQCYRAAVPFFKNTVIGDLFWTSALFGTYAIVSGMHRSASLHLAAERQI